MPTLYIRSKTCSCCGATIYFLHTLEEPQRFYESGSKVPGLSIFCTYFGDPLTAASSARTDGFVVIGDGL